MTASLSEKRIKPYIIASTLFALLLLTTGKDLFHSLIKDYHFYWSESLLFGSFWWLFVPFVLLMRRAGNQSRPKFSILWALLFSLLHIAIFSFLVFSISALFFNHTFGFERVFTNAVADFSFSSLLIYAAANLIFTQLQKPSTREVHSKIRVSHRNQTILVDPSEILYIKTERPYIALVAKDKTYLQNDTLKGFLEQNISPNFVQIHKSTVVNINFITSFKSRKNGDYDVLMANNSTLRASRNFSSFLKSRI